MKKRLSRRSLLKLAPAGAFSVTALAASADQVSASLIPPLPSADGTLARPPLSHVDPELEKRTSNPANASSSHVRLFARTNGQVYSVDDQTPAAVWPVSERVFDVAAYGATGDPLIDDASYIQNAINAAVAAGGGIVDFGDTSKTYQIGATLGLGSNLVLRGHATLRLKDGANVTMLSIYQKTNILIEGLTFDGNKANNTSTGLVGILLNNTSATIDIDNVVIRNVTIRDVNGYGIRVGIGSGGSYSRRVRIEGCRIEGTVRHGINANHKAPGIIIRGNIIKNTTNADSTGEANGIRVSNNSPDSVITDNHIEDPADMGIELWTNCGGAVVCNNRIHSSRRFGISLSDAPNSTVSGNVITDVESGYGIEVIASSYSSVTGNVISGAVATIYGITINKSKHVSVSGGTIRNVATGIRIFGDQSIAPDYTAISGVAMEGVTTFGVDVEATNLTTYGLSITGCVIKLTGTSSHALNLATTRIRHATISGNTIETLGGGGIQVNRVNEAVISGNTIISTVASAMNGIFMAGNGTGDITIVGNRIAGFTSGNGIYVATAPSYFIIVANDLRDNLAGVSNNSTTSWSYTIRNNLGYSTEASGSAAVPANSLSVDVAHGLAKAPTRVYISPTNDYSGRNHWVSSKDSTGDKTKFTITLGGTHTSPITFDWRAIVSEE